MSFTIRRNGALYGRKSDVSGSAKSCTGENNEYCRKLELRGITPFDAPWLFKITGDPVATKYLGFRTHDTVHDASRLIETYLHRSPSTWLAIVDSGRPGELLGAIGYETSGHSVTVAIYTNLHDRRARGAARLVFQPLIRQLLQQPSIWRVWSHVHVDNTASRRATEKVGGKLEGIMRRYTVFPNMSDEPQDCALYSITKDDLK